MKRYLLLFLAFGLACFSSHADAQFKIYGETDTKWPGIRLQVFWLERISPDRLVVGVRLRAMPEAPVKGTLIGYPVPIPAGLTPQQITAGDYVPRPFSLASSVMTEDATKQDYPTLPNVAPPGQQYYPSQGLATLAPGEIVDFTIQFQVPPPPPQGQPPVKQTVTFLFTNASGPIRSILLPPPLGTPPAGSSAAP